MILRPSRYFDYNGKLLFKVLPICSFSIFATLNYIHGTVKIHNSHVYIFDIFSRYLSVQITSQALTESMHLQIILWNYEGRAKHCQNNRWPKYPGCGITLLIMTSKEQCSLHAIKRLNWRGDLEPPKQQSLRELKVSKGTII